MPHLNLHKFEITHSTISWMFYMATKHGFLSNNSSHIFLCYVTKVGFVPRSGRLTAARNHTC